MFFWSRRCQDTHAVPADYAAHVILCGIGVVGVGRNVDELETGMKIQWTTPKSVSGCGRSLAFLKIELISRD
jgi:hypothetical protein